MVNIEQITSTLAKLPDQALQRYAMMHKDDPYIMSLAVSESKRRKEMRSAGQGQMQPQPKVVDQMVAQMAPQQQMPTMPEEQGIGALPAAAQMNFADGGITGYAGGGEVESYQDRGLVRPYETPYDRMNRQNREAAQAPAPVLDPIAQKYQLEAEEMGMGTRMQFSPDVKAYVSQVQAAEQAPQQAYVEKERALMLSKPASAQASAVPTMPTPGYTRPGMANDPRLATPVTEPLSAPAGPVPKPKAEAGPQRTGPSAARSPAAPAMSIEDRFLASQKKMTDQPNPFALQESAVQTEAEKLAKDKLASVEARQAMFKDAFKGREGRLEERAKELEKSKDTNTGLAFLEAGLAIMSTPGGLATAIGKGAREGTAKYAAGIDKLRSAKDKLDEAKDRMEELKLNRDEMSAKEKAEAELGIQQTVLSGKKDALSSAKTLFGDRSALSQKIVETTIGMEEKDKDRASRDRATAASAAQAKAQLEATLSSPERLAFQGFLAKTVSKDMPMGDPSKAYQDMMLAKQEPKSIQQLKHDWSTDMMLQNKYKDVNDYIKFMSGSSGTGASAPSSGKVPPPPSGFKLNG